MIKAVIFDLNGVFVQSPRLSDRYAREFGVPTADFLPALKEVMGKVRRPGAGDSFLYWQPYLEKWGVKFNREEFFKHWFEAEGGNLEMIELAKKLKARGLKLFILSNNFAERSEYYKQNFKFLDELFDKIYYSWQTGFVKSDDRAYKLVLEENNLQPEECLFFDDSESNIEIAKSLGMKAFIFEGKEKTQEIIEIEKEK
ncbi:MAG: HAD family phosphatase [Candidatus Vogelbacteria bacterium]|nr:HAD family phosphatase [Candidatus Vogelbacteria bacterium]